ncbi:SRPBCC domain-containing protein [uncultured Mucilaginibacter sp.]|uniref:SRPBCC domain-containing protein n=1 Tax=uncultured Mucilaginibacter sp. TaxID=797541 RepID=UPI0025E38992|nr:SRPBCC domain-containing protein [uncultured Mucilaginibacter sp.]
MWEFWNHPSHITSWAFASDDWHAPHAENDLRTGGSFKTTMAAKDGSFSFDFGGKYDRVEDFKSIAYTIDDGRKVAILFEESDGQTIVTETFEPEDSNPIQMQQDGWQAILNNFKKYTESK